jgi:hypothetical protein
VRITLPSLQEFNLLLGLITALCLFGWATFRTPLLIATNPASQQVSDFEREMDSELEGRIRMLAASGGE